MRTHGEDLDAKGMPDLDDSLPQKELTGDAQEGLVPPADHLQAPDDIYAQDTLDQRLNEEVPDRLDRSDDPPHLMGRGAEALRDGSAFAETGDEAGALSPEESAVHVTAEPGGVVHRDVDSYTGEPIP